MGTGYTRNDTADNIADGNVINASDLDGEFNAIVAAFSETTGHTHDGTANEGAPITVVGPTQDLVVSATDVLPKTDATLDLGSGSKQFVDGYFSGEVTAATFVGDLTGDVTGNADTASALETGRTITLSGEVSGSTTFDGSSNVSITCTVSDSALNDIYARLGGANTFTSIMELESTAPQFRFIETDSAYSGSYSYVIQSNDSLRFYWYDGTNPARLGLRMEEGLGGFTEHVFYTGASVAAARVEPAGTSASATYTIMTREKADARYVRLDGTGIPGPYANDAAAASGGVAVGALYKNSTSGAIHYRVS